MEKRKQSVDESLNKIRYMINYDSSKTLTENEGTIAMEQTVPGEMAGRTAKGAAIAAGAGYLGAPMVAGYMGVPAIVPMGAIASTGAVMAGAAALGLIPLILWLNDKDKMRPKVEKLFKYVETNKAKIDQIERGLSDEEIWDASDTLYAAMRRLGTREKDVYRVFESLQTISDLSALIAFYNQDNDVPLLKQLNRDFDMTKEWMRIYRPVRNLVLKFAKQAEEIGKQEEERKRAEEERKKSEDAKRKESERKTPVVPGVAASTYKFAKGTGDDPYKYGTYGSGIAQIQANLDLVQDGKWGPKTQAKMKEFAPNYINGYTNDDLLEVIQTIRSKTSPLPGKVPGVAQRNVAREREPLTLAPAPPKAPVQPPTEKRRFRIRK